MRKYDGPSDGGELLLQQANVWTHLLMASTLPDEKRTQEIRIMLAATAITGFVPGVSSELRQYDISFFSSSNT